MSRNVGLLLRLTLAGAVAAILAAQNKPLDVPPAAVPAHGVLGRVTNAYQDRAVEPVSFANSPRLETLIRGGNLYLSLADAVALALENNLDIELQRYAPRIAETDLLRARGGASLRGFTLSVREGPSGVGGPRTAQTQGVAVQLNQPVDTNLSINVQSGLSEGPPVPSLDPAIVGLLSYARNSSPQTSNFLTGTNALIAQNSAGNVQLQKGFLTGGNFGVGFANSRTDVNNRRADINPAATSNISFNFTQPLLRGFGLAVNNRFIRIAKNNRIVSDLAFEQQAIATVAAAVRLYWDLVSLNEDLRVRRQSLELANQLLANNQEQVEAGTLAPIDVVRTRAEVARARMDLTVGETLVRQQDTVLKSFLSRGSVIDPALANTRIIPTETIRVPENEPLEPIQDMVEHAVRKRPDLRQARIQLENAHISLKGSRSATLPELNFVATAQNNALYGPVNPLPPFSTGTTTNLVREPDPAFIGGLGTGLNQIFTGRFPNYLVGLQLNIPIGNRPAIADLVRDKLNVRQQEIRLRELVKQVEVDIQNALTAVQQARAAVDAAREQRTYQEQALEAEQEKLRVGLSTSYTVIQYERDLTQARSSEVAALGDYAKSRAALDRAVGTILENHKVSVEDAYKGRVQAKPDADL